MTRLNGLTAARVIAVILLPAFGLTSTARAQIPTIPGAGGLGGLGGAGGAADAIPAATSALPAAGGASPTTLWSFLGLSKSNLAACKQKICASPAGTMLNGMLGPVSTMTGGLVPTFCPAVPSNSQLAALAAAGGPTGAEAVAAKIKQDEADAKARRAAVRYLGTVSCHYWPEAEAAIIGALRDDRNECVRYEAALALLNGCCCTAKTIEALNIVVSGSEKDGKPSELSDRVKQVAFAALQGCLGRYQPPAAPEVPLERPEPASAVRTVEPLPPGFERVAYYFQTLKDVPADLIVASARRTVEQQAGPTAPTPKSLVTGERSVYHALSRAASIPPGTVIPPKPTEIPVEATSPTRTATPSPPPVSATVTQAKNVPPRDVKVAQSTVGLPPLPPPPSQTPATVRPAKALQTKRSEPTGPMAARVASPERRNNLRDLFLDSLRRPADH